GSSNRSFGNNDACDVTERIVPPRSLIRFSVVIVAYFGRGESSTLDLQSPAASTLEASFLTHSTRDLSPADLDHDRLARESGRETLERCTLIVASPRLSSVPQLADELPQKTGRLRGLRA